MSVKIFFTASFAACALGCLAALGCSDRKQSEECYQADPWEDEINAAEEYRYGEEFFPDVYGDMVAEIGFCDSETSDYETIFPGRDPDMVDRFSWCDPGASTDECTACGETADAVDEQILDAYDARQTERGCGEQREVLAFERGCMGTYLVARDAYACCYKALVVSECSITPESSEVGGGAPLNE